MPNGLTTFVTIAIDVRHNNYRYTAVVLDDHILIKTFMKRISLLALFISVVGLSFSQVLPYKNPQLSPEERAKDLVSRLTLEEKAILMCDQSDAIERLDIPKFQWWSEALHGYANITDVTVFPQTIGMAASFDDELLYKVFDAISDEGRAKYQNLKQQGKIERFHHLSVWTPNVNIFRDPRWGRGQETYGEDPYLTSRMGIAVVKGLQGDDKAKYRKLLACAKHYAVHSGPESLRHSMNITEVNPYDLWETYMPAFKALVTKAKVEEVMCAYQRLDDEPCCGSNQLLQTILRYDWGFNGVVVSDCGAIADFYRKGAHETSSSAMHAAAKGVIAGTDVECGFGYAYMELPKAVEKGLITEAEIDKHVFYLLKARFQLGDFDDDSLVEWAKIPYSVVNCDKHKQLAREMAQKSIVLLQNKNNTLPLKKTATKIAVVGPNANEETVMWGNYNGFPFQTTTILDGIKKKLAKPNNLIYDVVCDLTEDKALESLLNQCSYNGKQGFYAEYFGNKDYSGEKIATDQINHAIALTTFGQHEFAPGVPIDNFSGIYKTVLKPKQSDKIALVNSQIGIIEIFVNGKSITKNEAWAVGRPAKHYIDVKAGEEYNIEIRFKQREHDNSVLNFDLGIEREIDYTASLAKLKNADIVIFAGGISAKLEGEEMPVSIPGFVGGDRTDIELPMIQRKMLKMLKAEGKKVIFVNCSGSAMGLEPETESCDAILQAWYAGEAGGDAIADVLFGDFNPSGHLPVTFYKNASQLPDFNDYNMKGRTYRYMTEKPLFPFGYGLSYTTFAVGTAKVSSTTINAGEKMALTIPVTNKGKYNGDCVLQVYIRNMNEQNGAIKTLKEFKRINLNAKQNREVMLELPAETFQSFNTKKMEMAIMPGEYEILYGTSSDDNDLKAIKVTIN